MKYIKLNNETYDNGARTLWIDRTKDDYMNMYLVKIDAATVYRTGKNEVAQEYLEDLVLRLNKRDSLLNGEDKK